MSWEYMTLTAPASNVDSIRELLNELGSIGWEMCGFASADPMIGLNSYTAVVKRAAAQYPEPGDVDEAAWHPDPSGRHERRYWDGLRWTQHVVDGEQQTTDWPIVRT